ncbi:MULTISPECIES: dTDP-4-dehydrorhamnose 3,5-epimerase family protein [unclassified Agromyces]|uniref:dTDP-4-dehydrorhamnose 3,5-epimerase family protein n=1 Tax=unclassified Agromyces TaxID=2639701 RepID=UPI00366C45CE
MTEVQETPIPGCVVVGFHRAHDDRGSFERAYSADELAEVGHGFWIVQANVATTTRAGTVRGLHYQLAPYGEQKLVRCVRGAVFDVAVDLREGSPARGRWFGIELTPENGLAILIPRGCAHGYLSLLPDSQMVYFSDAAYWPAAERVLAAEHEETGIAWPIPVVESSAKDAAASRTDRPEWSGY